MNAQPQQFTTADGTLQGSVNGTNQFFTTGVVLVRRRVFWNGVAMTEGVDCVTGPRSVSFLGTQIPQAGDIITVQGYVQG